MAQAAQWWCGCGFKDSQYLGHSWVVGGLPREEATARTCKTSKASRVGKGHSLGKVTPVERPVENKQISKPAWLLRERETREEEAGEVATPPPVVVIWGAQPHPQSWALTGSEMQGFPSNT